MTTKHSISPLVKGLSVINLNAAPPAVPNVVCNVSWGDLQDSAGGAILPNNPIDKWLASGVPGVVRLYLGRGYGNKQVPTFALDLGRVTVLDPQDGVSAPVARWWEADVQAAQKDLITRLAAKYDGVIPLIYIANGATIYAEPFQRGTMGTSSAASTTRHNLVQAGYTPDKDKASYTAGYAMFAAFRETRLAQAFNPWQSVDPVSMQGFTDVNVTIEMMDAMAAHWPRRAVWANNSIRAPITDLGSSYGAMYQHMRDANATGGRPLRFQTATAQRVGSFKDTLEWAVSVGAHCVEVQSGYNAELSASEVASFNTRLRAN